MKGRLCWKSLVILATFLLLGVPAAVSAQGDGAKAGTPPIAQQLVREGYLAVKLTAALGLGSYDNEAEAESRLGEAGISPRNGWIADYPVTPDIVGELQKSVGDAADARKIALTRDEALKRLAEINAQASLPVQPAPVAQGSEVAPAQAETYPEPADLDEYYSVEGPPVVTYYVPPPDYYYLYSWVPYPFWCTGVWFPGFFVLNDFHRPFYFRNRLFFVSNHFHDFRSQRVFRIDPVGRFRGREFGGIGVNGHRGFVPQGMPQGGHHPPNGFRSRAPVTTPAATRTFRSGGVAPAARPMYRGSGGFAPTTYAGAVTRGTTWRAANYGAPQTRVSQPRFVGGTAARPSYGGGGFSAPSWHVGGGGSFGRGGRR